MRKRTLACLSMVMLAVLLLTGCGTPSGGNSGTPLPTIPPTDAPATAPPAPTNTPVATADPNAQAAQDAADEEDAEAPEDGETGEALNLLVPPPQETDAVLAQVLFTANPAETPIGPIDPIDKPTLEPLNVAYVPYSSQPMGVSFDRPAGWKEDAPADSNVQFVEPEVAAREGYRTMLTIRLLSMGSKQDKADAKVKLEELLAELGQNGDWTEFKPTEAASASMAGADGYYAYYSAFYQGTKLRGRIMVVAKNNNLYMVRVTCPASFYSRYEEVYRKVRSTWKFL